MTIARCTFMRMNKNAQNEVSHEIVKCNVLQFLYKKDMLFVVVEPDGGNKFIDMPAHEVSMYHEPFTPKVSLAE